MAKFISREKLSKRARKDLDNQKRTVWAFSPTTKKVESKKTLQQQEKRSCIEGWLRHERFCFVLNYSTINPFAFSAAMSASFAGPDTVPVLLTV